MYEQLLQFKIERGLILCCFLKFLFINTVNADSFISSDSTEYFIINKINITGNKTTKDKIILRELLFKQEDTINKNIFDKYLLRSRENLLNTSLFNFVTILFEEIDNNRICINISVEERWYLWPYPILEHADRNLNSFIHNQKWYRFNYGLYLIKYNFRGAKEILKLKARFGFREQYGFIYSIPYIHKSQKIGLESEFFYFRQKEIIYKTENNLPVYFRLNDRYIYKSFRSKITCSYRSGHDNYFFFITGYDYGNIADTITILNPYYYCYGKKISRFFSSSATWKRDKRDSRYYPLKGYLSSVTLSKFGLGTIYDDINIIMTEGTINNYLLLFRYLYYASGIHLRLSHNFNNDEYPYTLIKALGYENNLRGYDYYIIDGQHFIIIKQSLKYKLLSASEREIKFIPLEKFRKIYYATYCEIFFETGYVYNHNEHPTVNSMENRLLYGGGIGFTFSSYYDWVFRLEYSLNHLFESGFFIHLGAPI